MPIMKSGSVIEYVSHRDNFKSYIESKPITKEAIHDYINHVRRSGVFGSHTDEACEGMKAYLYKLYNIKE